MGSVKIRCPTCALGCDVPTSQILPGGSIELEPCGHTVVFE